MPLTTLKAGVGECLGASGALQAAELLSALADGVLPGIAPLDEIEPGLPVSATAGRQVLRSDASGGIGLVTAVGLDGPVAALVIEGEPSNPPARRAPVASMSFREAS